MSRRVLAIAVLGVLGAPALAQPLQGGHSAGQPQVQDRLVNAYGQALVDYTACLRFTGNAARCGASPEAVQVLQQRHPLQQDVRVTDYYCVERQIRGGQPWANAMQACTRYQQQQSIGGYGQMFPDATERDILDAQTGAINAFSQCVTSSAPGTYCGPPP
jgi:hypothetical protein